MDKTRDHRLNIASNIYSNNDTIFKYGGYGYWSQRDFIIYYDTPTHEWQIYKVNYSDYKPEGMFKGLHFKTEKGIYFFGGYVVNKNNRIKSNPNKDDVYFDFKTKKYSYLGKAFKDFDKSTYLIKDDKYIYFSNRGELIQLDLLNNEIAYYDLPNKLWQFSSDKRFNVFRNGEYFVSLQNDSNDVNNFVKLTRKEFLSNPLVSEKFYAKDYNLLQILISITTALFLLICYLIYREFSIRKLIVLNSFGLVFKKTHYPLNEEEIIFLKKLTTSGEISTKTAMNIFENKELTYSHNTRIKDKKIKELNIKLKTIFNFEEFPIKEIRSSIDKRIKVFIRNKEFEQISNKIQLAKDLS